MPIDKFADGIRAASVLARIDATMIVANRVHRAVLGTGAVALRLAAPLVRVAHEIRWALTDGIVRWSRNAQSCFVAGARMAGLDRDAFDVGDRIGSQSRWTLTDRPVIVSNADRVHPASVFVASVVASVRQSVAELGRRAIDVVDTGNRSTSLDPVVRISHVQARWAFAIGNVIVDHAQSVRAAGNEIADRLTSQQTFVGAPAGLVLGTLAVGRALILPRCLTALSVVRIAHEAG